MRTQERVVSEIVEAARGSLDLRRVILFGSRARRLRDYMPAFRASLRLRATG